jgi:hypothetical protein
METLPVFDGGADVPGADPLPGAGNEPSASQSADQPVDSRIEVADVPGGVTFKVPALGIKGGAGFLLVFSCLWLAFVGLFAGLAIFSPANMHPPPQENPATFLGILGSFSLIGVGILLLSIHLARRQAAIAVADGRCLVVKKGLFGEKSRVWEPGDLVAVQVGPSGTTVNDKPVMELQFMSRAGEKFGALSGRDVPELEWLATRLRAALRLVVADERKGIVAGDVENRPPGSNVQFQDLSESLTINVPRSPWRKIAPLWIVTLFVEAVFAGVAAACILGEKEAGATGVVAIIFAGGAIVSLAMFCTALHMAIRRAEIAVAHDRLLVVQLGLFGKRRSEWSVDELAAVRACASGAKVNNRDLLQLEIVPLSGKRATLLMGRDEQELAWIATLLRRKLALPAEAPA